MGTAPPEQDVLRRVAAWPDDGLRTTTLYLDVDGKRWPRRGMFVRRAEDLTKRMADEVDREGRDARREVARDRERILEFVRGVERKGDVRGLAAFSASGGERFEGLALPQPIRDHVRLGDRPYVLPLEALLEMAETFCTAVVDREKARLLLSRLGRVEEISSFLDDVPGKHDQGGWAQARMQRHIEDHVQRHLKHVAEALLRVYEARRFDHLVLAGPDEAVAELERELHDYLRQIVLERVSLPMTVSPTEVLERTTDLQGELEARRETQAVERLASEVQGATGRAVAGMDPTLLALEQRRVELLVVLADLEARGVRCATCGHLATGGERCGACGGEVVEVRDLVEVAVEDALGSRCRVETVPGSASLEALGGIGALLRF